MFILRLIISSILLLLAIGLGYLSFNIWGITEYVTSREIAFIADIPHYWIFGIIASVFFILAILILPIGKLFKKSAK